MKLYYSPGACSLSPHIVLRELGAPFELVKVNLKTKRTADDRDFTTINPKGYVPALELDDGQVLTEGPAIVQYLADRNPQAQLAPANGTLQRYRLQEWLNFISTELHKQFSPLFAPNTPDATKDIQRERLANRFDWVSRQLQGRDYLLGNAFSVADAYLFTVLSWCGYVGIDLAKWPTLAQYQARVAARPAVQQALQAEGLKK
ncbi:MAG: glutathione transferase GstA [Burkholderiaceae bacterium]|nr:glutathione transferase GstA [Burkholderiaceae bacterium]